MRTCSACGKVNQPHYQFCLGCGASMEAAAAAVPVASAPASTVCVSCGKGNSPQHRFCLGCGAELAARPATQASPAEGRCPNCGSPVLAGQAACSNCGGPLPRAVSPSTAQRPQVVIAVAVLVAVAGVLFALLAQ